MSTSDTSNKKRLFQALGGLMALTIIVAWLSGAFESRVGSDRLDLAAEPLAEGETTFDVTHRAVDLMEWTSGSVASARQTTVAARVLARIDEVHVVAGNEVEEGQLLVSLDNRDFRARLNQTTEALNAAKSRLTLAQSEKDRVEELVRTGAATVQRLDQMVSDLQVANAEVTRLEQAADEARTALSYTRITSPVSGRIVDRVSEPGETAAPGRALLYIYDPSVLRVEVPVRESRAVELELGQTLNIEIESLGLNIEGIIDEIVPYAEAGARTLMVKVRLPRTEGARIMAGMFARVGIPAGQGDAILIPSRAITRIGQLEYATVYADGRKERRLITSGPLHKDAKGEDMIRVLSGLRAGETIVLP